MNDMVYLSFSLLQKCSCHGPTSEDSFDKAWKVSAYYITMVVRKLGCVPLDCRDPIMLCRELSIVSCHVPLLVKSVSH